MLLQICRASHFAALPNRSPMIWLFQMRAARACRPEGRVDNLELKTRSGLADVGLNSAGR